MKRFRVGNWYIHSHENGVVEFTNGKKRNLMISIIADNGTIQQVFDALPRYVVDRFLWLVDNDHIKW